MQTRHVFVTGGTGYLGRPLIERLLARGHTVTALARGRSAGRLPAGASVIEGDALDATSYATRVASADTFVHLVGTPKPNPSKAQLFLDVDLASLRAAVAAARTADVAHFIYLSVAQPAPVMRAYVAARAEGERHLRESGLNATMLRPWYVLGPGHRWPYALVPMYAVLRMLPATRAGAMRLGLVTHEQMVRALVQAVENPVKGERVVSVPEIRATS